MSKGTSNVVQAFLHLKKAHTNFQMFINEHNGSRGELLLKNYQKRIEWIKNDVILSPYLPDIVRQGVREEWESDEYTPDAIMEKVHLLSPEQRETLEILIDSILKGEKITVEVV